ncbi:hypothetical protein B0O80DRAFT_218313 [Mortierella sp. GBAus27b]|nr:hypothetical protein B0O80DRAFT_218313 [Mortierella sp. GBAus27b]
MVRGSGFAIQPSCRHGGGNALSLEAPLTRPQRVPHPARIDDYTTASKQHTWTHGFALKLDKAEDGRFSESAID